MMSVTRKAGALAGLMAGGLVTASVATSAQEIAPTPIALQFSPEHISIAILGEVGQLPANALTEDYEGSMMYVISQQNYTVPMIEQALDIVAANKGLNFAFREAIGRVRLAIMRRHFRGTAALGGGEGDFSGPGFSFPIVNIDDGSSNYES